MAQSSLKRFFCATVTSELQPAKRLLCSAAPAAKTTTQNILEDAVAVHLSQALSGEVSSEMIEKKKLSALERKVAAEIANFADLDAAIPSAWGIHLKATLAKPFWAQLKKSLQDQQSSGKIIFPVPGKVFAALHLTPLPDVRAVIVGQDP
jgi:hypothetical protein